MSVGLGEGRSHKAYSRVGRSHGGGTGPLRWLGGRDIVTDLGGLCKAKVAGTVRMVRTVAFCTVSEGRAAGRPVRWRERGQGRH